MKNLGDVAIYSLQGLRVLSPLSPSDSLGAGCIELKIVGDHLDWHLLTQCGNPRKASLSDYHLQFTDEENWGPYSIRMIKAASSG